MKINDSEFTLHLAIGCILLIVALILMIATSYAQSAGFGDICDINTGSPYINYNPDLIANPIYASGTDYDNDPNGCSWRLLPFTENDYRTPAIPIAGVSTEYVIYEFVARADITDTFVSVQLNYVDENGDNHPVVFDLELLFADGWQSFSIAFDGFQSEIGGPNSQVSMQFGVSDSDSDVLIDKIRMLAFEPSTATPTATIPVPTPTAEDQCDYIEVEILDPLSPNFGNIYTFGATGVITVYTDEESAVAQCGSQDKSLFSVSSIIEVNSQIVLTSTLGGTCGTLSRWRSSPDGTQNWTVETNNPQSLAVTNPFTFTFVSLHSATGPGDDYITLTCIGTLPEPPPTPTITPTVTTTPTATATPTNFPIPTSTRTPQAIASPTTTFTPIPIPTGTPNPTATGFPIPTLPAPGTPFPIPTPLVGGSCNTQIADNYDFCFDYGFVETECWIIIPTIQIIAFPGFQICFELYGVVAKVFGYIVPTYLIVVVIGFLVIWRWIL